MQDIEHRFVFRRKVLLAYLDKTILFDVFFLFRKLASAITGAR